MGSGWHWGSSMSPRVNQVASGGQIGRRRRPSSWQGPFECLPLEACRASGCGGGPRWSNESERTHHVQGNRWCALSLASTLAWQRALRPGSPPPTVTSTDDRGAPQLYVWSALGNSSWFHLNTRLHHVNKRICVHINPAVFLLNNSHVYLFKVRVDIFVNHHRPEPRKRMANVDL